MGSKTLDLYRKCRGVVSRGYGVNADRRVTFDRDV